MYAVVDLDDGATLDYFDEANSVREFLGSEIELDDLAVLRYTNGVRTGEPIPARRFLNANRFLVLSSIEPIAATSVAAPINVVAAGNERTEHVLLLVNVSSAIPGIVAGGIDRRYLAASPVQPLTGVI
jgi:hypothetical protein